jgi:hypothetical protein
MTWNTTLVHNIFDCSLNIQVTVKQSRFFHTLEQKSPNILYFRKFERKERSSLCFHFIDLTDALNIKRNFNTIVLVSKFCFKTLQKFHQKTSFKTPVKTLVDHRRSSYMFRITCIHHQGVCVVVGWSCDYNWVYWGCV